MSVVRIWRGWTRAEDAETYETLLRGEILPALAARGTGGFVGYEILRRRDGARVEFVTVLRFANAEALADWAGADGERAIVPARARALLATFEERTRHYEVCETFVARDDRDRP